MTHSKPHSGVKTSVDPTTASSGNSITDKSEDDIDLLGHITQEFEFVEKNWSPIHAKVQKTLQDLTGSYLQSIS